MIEWIEHYTSAQMSLQDYDDAMNDWDWKGAYEAAVILVRDAQRLVDAAYREMVK